ncbi:hypothetical protein QOZ80_3AG0228120 [Eleusine coracana subsp. coracana]|nr:hypothetical protein QOZ80_3AG0228120 [Eleusine coracana subsp. coracana]
MAPAPVPMMTPAPASAVVFLSGWRSRVVHSSFRCHGLRNCWLDATPNRDTRASLHRRPITRAAVGAVTQTLTREAAGLPPANSRAVGRSKVVETPALKIGRNWAARMTGWARSSAATPRLHPLPAVDVNSYPTVRGTAIGSGGDDFVQSMVVYVESGIQERIPEISQKVSSKGKYVFVQIGPIRVVFSEQVQAVYNAMKKDE